VTQEAGQARAGDRQVDDLARAFAAVVVDDVENTEAAADASWSETKSSDQRCMGRSAIAGGKRSWRGRRRRLRRRTCSPSSR